MNPDDNNTSSINCSELNPQWNNGIRWGSVAAMGMLGDLFVHLMGDFFKKYPKAALFGHRIPHFGDSLIPYYESLGKNVSTQYILGMVWGAIAVLFALLFGDRYSSTSL